MERLSCGEDSDWDGVRDVYFDDFDVVVDAHLDEGESESVTRFDVGLYGDSNLFNIFDVEVVASDDEDLFLHGGTIAWGYYFGS